MDQTDKMIILQETQKNNLGVKTEAGDKMEGRLHDVKQVLDH